MDKILFGLSLTEWLAVIGAFAWMPTIIQWFRDYLKKPKITMVSGKQFDVGYTFLGPILNMRIAFISENKKAIIDKVEVELIHENNDTQQFSWVWIEELFYTIDTPTGIPLNTKRNQPAIAVKIGLDDLVEKTVGFQQNNFQIESNKQLKLLQEEMREYSALGKPYNDLKATNSFRALKDLFSNSFFWKTGTYYVKIKVHTLGSSIKFKHEFEFNLTSTDIKGLRTNIDLCHAQLDEVIEDGEQVVRTYNWVTITKHS